MRVGLANPRLQNGMNLERGRPNDYQQQSEPLEVFGCKRDFLILLNLF